MQKAVARFFLENTFLLLNGIDKNSLTTQTQRKAPTRRGDYF
jgi:hypothetical protein